MADFRFKEYSYELIIRPWVKNKGRFEAIKWRTGFRNLWEKISYKEYRQDEDKYLTYKKSKKHGGYTKVQRRRMSHKIQKQLL